MTKTDMMVEKTVDELERIMTFKDDTNPGDVVLFISEGQDDSSPLGISYALVNGFERDTAKRDEWWHVHFTFLTIPPQPQTIILQTAHFTGQEVFTMGGKKVFIKAVDFSGGKSPEKPDDDRSESQTGKPSGLRVIK